MKQIQNYSGKILLFLVLMIPAVLIHRLILLKEFSQIAHVVEEYRALYVLVLILIKAGGTVYPPLPGVLATLASVPLIGWPVAYLADFIGSFVGASLAYFLGRRFGLSLLRKMVGATITKKVSSIKLKQKNQVEAAVFFRFASGGLLSDGLAWGASIIGFRYIPFISGYLIFHIITSIPIFYFVSASIAFESQWIFVIVIAVVWVLLLKLKGRYFE